MASLTPPPALPSSLLLEHFASHLQKEAETNTTAPSLPSQSVAAQSIAHPTAKPLPVVTVSSAPPGLTEMERHPGEFSESWHTLPVIATSETPSTTSSKWRRVLRERGPVWIVCVMLFLVLLAWRQCRSAGAVLPPCLRRMWGALMGPGPLKEEEDITASQTSTSITVAALSKAQNPKDVSTEALVTSPTDPFFQIFPH